MKLFDKFLSIEEALNITSEIDTMSESRTMAVWTFLEFVKAKMTEMSDLKKIVKIGDTELYRYQVIGPKENQILDMIFPRRSSTRHKHCFNLLGKGFKGWQYRALMERVCFKILKM